MLIGDNSSTTQVNSRDNTMPRRSPSQKQSQAPKTPSKITRKLKEIKGKFSPGIDGPSQQESPTIKPSPPPKDDKKERTTENTLAGTSNQPLRPVTAETETTIDVEQAELSRKIVEMLGKASETETTTRNDYQPHDVQAIYSRIEGSDARPVLPELVSYVASLRDNAKQDRERDASTIKNLRDLVNQLAGVTDGQLEQKKKHQEAINDLKKQHLGALTERETIISANTSQNKLLGDKLENLKAELQRVQNRLKEEEDHVKTLRQESEKKDESCRRAVELESTHKRLVAEKETAEANRQLWETSHGKLLVEFEAKQQQLGRLQTRLSDTAGELAEARQSNSTPLSLPESEIVKCWKELDFDVNNFVRTHLSSMNWTQKKIDKWVNLDDERLKLITPQYSIWLKDVNMTTWMAEAFVWQTLLAQVFDGTIGLGGLKWTGDHAKKLKRFRESNSPNRQRREQLLTPLTGTLVWNMVDDGTRPISSDRDKRWHAWKAHTSSLLSALTADNTREEAVSEITELVVEALEPLCSYRTRGQLHTALGSIVRKALTLDERMSCQQKWYYLTYPIQQYNVNLDTSCMRPLKGSGSGSVVAFVVRPGLMKAGGERGENYQTPELVDHCTVALSSRNW